MGRITLAIVLVLTILFSFDVSRTQNPLDRLTANAIALPPWAADGYGDPHTDHLAANHGELQNRLLLAMIRLGLHFDRSGMHHLDQGAVGTLYPHDRVIVLDNSFSIDARTEVLAHEIAHSLEPPRVEFTHGEAEVFAMGVSYLVVRHVYCDEDCEFRYASYLAMHKTSLDVLTVYRSEIEFAATVIWGEE
jgi:hypothetical protein